MATTAKIENVYSPAELFAKPIGTKPAIGDERAGQHRRRERPVGEGRRLFLVSPAASRSIMTSTVVIALSTSRLSAMISAPSEMRCRSMSADVHDREHDRERQRDRQRDDRAGAHAEADEAAPP